MNQKKKPSKGLWILFFVSVLMILYMWSSKDTSALTHADGQNIMPIMVTSFLVSLVKVGVIALVVAIGKYILNKFLTKK